MTNVVALLLHKILEVDSLSRRIRKAKQLCLGAGLNHNVLLEGASGQHHCLVYHYDAAYVRLPVGLALLIRYVDKDADNHDAPHVEHDATD